MKTEGFPAVTVRGKVLLVVGDCKPDLFGPGIGIRSWSLGSRLRDARSVREVGVQG